MLLIFLSGFLTTFFTSKYLMRKFPRRGLVAKDMYKKGRPEVPTLGGVAIYFGIIASLIATELLVGKAGIIESMLIFYFVVFSYGFFALLDDLVDVGRIVKVIVPFFLSLPIALLNVDTSLSLYFTEVELGPIFTYLVAPLYLMVVANLVNMHSGFNGLCTGLSLILLLAIMAKVLMLYHDPTMLYYSVPVFSSLLAFFLFNRYPSRFFEGNVGSFILGSSIGGLLILYNIEFFGVIILVPHIVNFLLYIYWRVRGYPLVKFGRIRRDGTLWVPNNLTLKWIPAYYFRMKEWQCVLLMYLLTAIFCFLGLKFF